MFVGEGDGGFFTEGGIGEDVVEPVTGVSEEGIGPGDGDGFVDVADVVEVEVHEAEFEGGGYDLPAVEGVLFEVFFLFAVEGVGGFDEVFACKEESAASAAGVCNGFEGFGTDTGDHGTNEGSRSKVLACSAFYVFCVFLEESFVYFSFDIRGEGGPGFSVDHLNDFGEDGSGADFVCCAFEDFSEDSFLFSECVKGCFVLVFEFCSLEGVEFRPGVSGRDAGLFVVGRAGVLIGHFEEDKVGELFEVVSIGDASVP